jgi:urea transport system substrate-binding protein
LDTPANKKFVANFQDWLKKTSASGVQKDGRVTCSPMVLSYNGVYLWKAAVEKAGTYETGAVLAALKEGISFDGPGGTVTSQENHHLTKNVYIGEILEDGQFDIIDSFEEPPSLRTPRTAHVGRTRAAAHRALARARREALP